MDANTLLRFALLASLLTSSGAMTNDNLVVLPLGKPSAMKISTSTSSMPSFNHMFRRWGDSDCQFGLCVHGGTLKVGDEETVRVGSDARIACQWGNRVTCLATWLPDEIVWLEQHEFGSRGNDFKD